MTTENKKHLELIARDIRKDIVCMHARSKSSHIGSALSIVDLLAVLYFRILNLDAKNYKKMSRDRLILSKGHAASALYATLVKKGIINKDKLQGYCLDGGSLCGHCDDFRLPGIEATTGSLGHGLSVASGMAFAAKYDEIKNKIFVIMGDGECNEGSVWEAAMFASHNKLDNITVIIDRNHLQGLGNTEKVMKIDPLLDKWKAFGWQGCYVDGHNLAHLLRALRKLPFKKSCPTVIIANTIKGKGISFMENRLEWHYRSPSDEHLARALKELEGIK